jgi:polar amino acid transport system substrate-binding protein
VKRFLIVCVALAWLGAFTGACASKGVVAVRDARPTVAAPGGAADPAASAVPNASYRVAVEGDFPPFETVDASGQRLTGFDVDLMQAVAERAGLNVEFVNVGANRLLSGVLSCQYDAGISAIAITDQLRQQLAFSQPYLSVGQVIVVKKGNIAITGRDTLAGMVVGALNGSPSAARVQQIPDVTAQPYPTLDEAFNDLITGNVDAVVASRTRALRYVGIPANRLKIAANLDDAESATEDLGIAICPRDTDLVQKINEGLAAVKADGTLDRLSNRWLAGSVSLPE